MPTNSTIIPLTAQQVPTATNFFTASELFAHEYHVTNLKEPSTCAFIDVAVHSKMI